MTREAIPQPAQQVEQTPTSHPLSTGILQRQCACGKGAGLTGRCGECEGKRLTLQRKAVNGAGGVAKVPPIVHEVLKASKINLKSVSAVSRPDDIYEQEADQLAEQVMRLPEQNIRESLQTKPNLLRVTQVQRSCGTCKSENSFDSTLPASLQRQIYSAKGSGQQLSKQEKIFFESRFRTDFSNINIHTDSRAGQMARTLNARAFTHGEDIFFAPGQYAPESNSSRYLIAHELVHTLQQRNSYGELVQRQVDGDEEVEPGTEEFDPEREILTVSAFDRRYPGVLRAYNDLSAAMYELNDSVQAHFHPGISLDTAQLIARYQAAHERWQQADDLLEQYWSIARVTLAMRRAGQILVSVNRMVRMQTSSSALSVTIPSLLSSPHQQALRARDRLNALLASRSEFRRLHEVIEDSGNIERSSENEVQRPRTSSSETTRASARTERVRRATLALWRYARRHINESVDFISQNIHARAIRFTLEEHRLNGEEIREVFEIIRDNDRPVFEFLLFNNETIRELRRIINLEDLRIEVDSTVLREGNIVLTVAEGITGEFAPLAFGSEDDVSSFESSYGAIAVDTSLGLLPIIDQIFDARDLAAHLTILYVSEQERTNPTSLIWRSVGIAFTLIGLVPEVGTAIKGVSKIITRPVRRHGAQVVSFVVDIAEQVIKRFAPWSIDTLLAMRRTIIANWNSWADIGQRFLSNKIDELVGYSRFLSGEVGTRLRLLRASLEEVLPNAFIRAKDIFVDLLNTLADRLRRGGSAASDIAENAISVTASFVHRKLVEIQLLVSRIQSLFSQISPTQRMLQAFAEVEEAQTVARRLLQDGDDASVRMAQEVLSRAQSRIDEIMQEAASISRGVDTAADVSSTSFVEDTIADSASAERRVAEARAVVEAPRRRETPSVEESDSTARRATTTDELPEQADARARRETPTDTEGAGTDDLSDASGRALSDSDLESSVAHSSQRDSITPEEAANEVEYLERHPELVEGTPPHQHARLSDEHEIVQTPTGCVRRSEPIPVLCPIYFTQRGKQELRRQQRDNAKGIVRAILSAGSESGDDGLEVARASAHRIQDLLHRIEQYEDELGRLLVDQNYIHSPGSSSLEIDLFGRSGTPGTGRVQGLYGELQREIGDLNSGIPRRIPSDVRANVIADWNRRFPSDSGNPIDVISGRPLRRGDLEIDHIVPRSQILGWPDFWRLSPEHRREVLNLPANLMPLSSSANASKSNRSIRQWLSLQDSSVTGEIQPWVWIGLLAAEEQAMTALRAAIAARLT